ncbi:MAG: S9 family peptidase [Bacteroidia bacterium]|nr:S9 family peptidase [Bacteroidota bacterium]MBP9082672.1 S9 family peptidase [Bacteroidia bacterium]
MKNIKITMLCGLLLLTSFVSAQNSQLKLEDIWASRQFTSSGLGEVRSMKDGIHFTEMVSNAGIQYITKVEFKTGNTKDTIWSSASDKSQEKKMEISNYQFSADETKLLLETESEPIYRHSTKSNNYVYDVAAKSTVAVSKNGKQQYASFSPEGKSVCFVRDNNLYLVNLSTNQETQITSDGKRNEIINGATDWVYEEEFSFDKGFQWSPDGKSIAYYRFDESAVKEFNLTYYGTLYPKEEKYKYPKAGEINSTVEIYIYNIATGKAVKADVNKEADQYIPRIKWTSDNSKLCVMRLNRLQNLLELYAVNSSTGKSELMFSESNKAYIEITDHLTFMKKSNEFIWTSTLDGFNHIYLYDLNGKLKQQITKGKWDVTDFYGYDEASGTYYFQAAMNSPMEKQVYAVSKGGTPRLISPSTGTSDAKFSANFKFYFITNSKIDQPHIVTLHIWSGKQVRVIKDNKKVSESMSGYNLSKTEFFNFTTSEGVSLNGWMIKPTDFNPSKKYPVFQYMYGGPNSQTVKNEWLGPNYFWFQMLAQNGYIIVSVDNRGTGARGEAFNKCIYKQLGKLETIDQIEVAKWMGKQTYVDASRIGAFGWSYGGYMTSLLMTKGADYFKAAIAVAPVTNWRYYDTIYTERYLQTPQMNATGYDENSPINFTDKLKGNYLLVHGTTDDNVHMQNSMEMVTSLVKEKKQFDSFYYPNKAHGISGVRLHLYQKMTNFILEKL